ncbi:MAG: hypothetical protein Q8O17_00800 [Candidatus Methanoperedens sp.]|nr:hypothetical protein [Candidatus Methanoperedens sp.]
MIFDGKSIQSVADAAIYPFLNNLLQSEDETVVRETLNEIRILAALGIERKNFIGLQKVLYHKDIDLAHSSLDLLREMHPGIVKDVELRSDVLVSMYPFFCEQVLSAPDVAIESLNILDALIDYGIVGDYKDLQKALLHESDKVAYLALDVLRKIERLTGETKIERVKLVSAEILRVQQIKEKTFEEPRAQQVKERTFEEPRVQQVKEKTLEAPRVQQIKERTLEAPRVQQVKERTLEAPMVQQVKKRPLEEPTQKEEDIQSRIIDVLKKNPKYVEGLKEIKSKYKR